jgi:hypothetical protein
MKNYDLSSLCRDAFVLLHGVTRITYRDGSFWETEDDEREHPLIPRLRAASLQSLVEEPPVDGPLAHQLANERAANDAMRLYLEKLQTLCVASGAPKDAGAGDLLAWLERRLVRE